MTDFLGSFFAVTLVARGARGGFRAPFWTRDASQRLAVDRSYVTEVSVKYGLSLVPTISVTLKPSYREAIEFLDSQLIEFGESLLEVQYGWISPSGRARLSPVFSGLLLKPDVQLGTDMSITLKAQGIGTFNVHSDGVLQALNGTRESILRTLLARDGRALDLDVSAVRSAGPEVQQAFFRDDLNISQAGRTDWQLLSQLVWEARCWYFLETRNGRQTVRVVPRFASFTDDTAFRGTLYAFGAPNGRYGYDVGTELALPILSVSTNSAGQYLPAETLPSAVTTRGVDPRTGQVSSETTGAAQAVTSGGAGGHHPQERTAAGVRPTSPTQTGSNALVLPGDSADSIARTQRESAYEDFRNRIGIQLDVETLGIPDLLPGQTFAVKGLGRRIDGPARYLVLEGEHKCGTGAYKTSLKLVSNLTFAQSQRSAVNATGNAAIAAHNEGSVARNRELMRSVDAAREDAEFRSALAGLGVGERG